MMASTCASCGSGLAPAAAVRLWDGRDYCRGCVEAACPGLAEYAETHPQLAETLQFSRRSFAWGLAKLYLACVAIFGALALLATASGHGPGMPGPLFAIPAVSVVALIAAAIQAPMHLALLREALPSVTVQSGRITVTRPVRRSWLGGQGGIAAADLDECRWYPGRLRGDSLLRTTVIPSAPAIILVFPCLWPARLRVACGYTPEMRRRWQGFLTLAGVPRE